MLDNTDLSFFHNLGVGFVGGFAGLTALTAWQFQRVVEISRDGLDAVHAAYDVTADPLSPETGAPPAPIDPSSQWTRLIHIKAELASAVTRAQLTANSVPTLALLATCLGFYFAMRRAGVLDLGRGDPLALLDALLDGGVSTALAGTVGGQAIYLVLGQVWAVMVAGHVEACMTHLDEHLALLRGRMQGSP